jgi:hypothetical protein
MTQRIIACVALILLAASVVSAQTVIPGGNVSGTWNLAGSPYLVEGEITVPTGQTLTIEPGVTVDFQGHYKMIVNGTLTAVGDADNMITFTADNSVSGWHSIRFLDAPDGSELTWCWFEYGRATGTLIEDKRGGAIYFFNSGADVSRCVFVDNSAQWGGAVYSWQGSPSFENCTIYGNDAGDAGGFTNVGGTPTFVNTIFWGNTGVYQINGTPGVSYSCIEGGYTGLGNISDDPMFVDPATWDFHLQEGSPCVDSGDPNSPLDPDGSRADMGVFYLHHDPLAAPYNLEAELDSLTGEVTLTWWFDGGGGPGGEIDTLIYDNGVTGNGYTYLGYTMATQMSPDGPCDLLTLLYNVFVSPPGSDDEFNAEVYDWAGSQPGTNLLYEELVTTDPIEDFTVVDVSGAAMSFTDDFMVGFGSLNATTFLGFDPMLNNGRSWDLNTTTMSWAPWNEAYIIRAVVQYESGEIDILEPVAIEATPKTGELGPRVAGSYEPQPQTDATDDFIEFIIYRNGFERGRAPDTTYVDQLPGYSTFTYTVTAYYDEGESLPCDPVEVTWYPVGVEPGDEGDLPAEFALSSAYPNPFNPTTNLAYALPTASNIQLVVYDVTGSEVTTLVNGWRDAGYHEVTFDAEGLASGVYLYRLTAGTFQAEGKMILMK